jgi:hypothetical protein
MTNQEAMKLALEALQSYQGFIEDAHILEGQWHWIDGNQNAITALEEALAKQEQRCEYCDGTGDVHDQTGEWRGVCVCETGAKQEQCEPVAFKDSNGNIRMTVDASAPIVMTPHPSFRQQRTWVGLTDDERLEVVGIDCADDWFWEVCKAIEAKLKEKNT